MGAAILAIAGVQLAIMLAINMLNYIDRQELAAVMPIMRGSFAGMTAVGASLLGMGFMLSYTILNPVFGGLKLPRWRIIGFAVIVWSLASMMTGWATAFAVLLLARCFVGVGEAAFSPFAPSMISDLFSESVRNRMMSLFYVATPVGSALGFVLGGLIAGSHLGWRWAFFVVGPPGILLGLLCFLMPDPAKCGSGSSGEAPVRATIKLARKQQYKLFFQTKSWIFVTLGMSAMTFAVAGIGFWMPTYITQYRHYQGSLAKANTLFGAILVVSGIAATALGGALADRLKKRYQGVEFLVCGVSMLIGFPFSIGMLYLPFPYAWFCAFGACFCLFVNIGPSYTIISRVVHPELRSSAVALSVFFLHGLGDVISPTIIGTITDVTHSMTTAFLGVSAMILVSGICFCLGKKYLANDAESAVSRAQGVF
jgi:MFS family permease